MYTFEIRIYENTFISSYNKKSMLKISLIFILLMKRTTSYNEMKTLHQVYNLLLLFVNTF